jgi:starch synthase
MNILMIAVENGALSGGKVGGVGDVIHELPTALAQQGCRVTVVVPSHGYLHQGERSEKIGDCRFRFGGAPQSAALFERLSTADQRAVRQLVIHHPAVSSFDVNLGRYRVYNDDPPDRPFFTDASRFAFFSAAVAGALAEGLIGPFDVIHLHDWHTAVVALLGRFHPDYAIIGKLRCVFSIHNLAFQGVRPLRGSESSLEAWFPELAYDWATVADPRWPDCVNLMAVGIRLADRVHTVSPNYAEEIRLPSLKPRFYGGEGLDADLEAVHREGRLIGILNGCRYPQKGAAESMPYPRLMQLIRRETIRWSGEGQSVPPAQFVAFARTLEPGAGDEKPKLLLTSVGRVGEQKMLLLVHEDSQGRSGLQAILEGIGPDSRYILLGSGDRNYERLLAAASARHENFIFVNGYSDACARALYAGGDLFLMPSSYEPCGLSQMLAMRAGQPCVVHAVGGLKDTVRHGGNGFSFSGGTVEAQVDRFVQTTLDAVALKRQDAAAWKQICEHAAAARFTWEGAAERYLKELYE